MVRQRYDVTGFRVGQPGGLDDTIALHIMTADGGELFSIRRGDADQLASGCQIDTAGNGGTVHLTLRPTQTYNLANVQHTEYRLVVDGVGSLTVYAMSIFAAGDLKSFLRTAGAS
jgi:hypothetical protein